MARFLRGEGGDTFCSLNTCDVKTLIKITKYLPKIDNIFQKDSKIRLLSYFALFYDFVTGFFTCYHGNHE